MPGWGATHPFSNSCRSPVSSGERRPPTPIKKNSESEKTTTRRRRRAMNRHRKSPIWPKLSRSVQHHPYNSGRADSSSFAIKTSQGRGSRDIGRRFSVCRCRGGGVLFSLWPFFLYRDRWSPLSNTNRRTTRVAEWVILSTEHSGIRADGVAPYR